MRSDLTGKRFGRLVVQGPAGSRNGKRLWSCLCDCGAVTTVPTGYLNNGDTRSCGCLHRDLAAEKGRRKRFDLVGQTFGRLRVESVVESSRGEQQWLCRCACGNTTTQLTSSLTRGGSLSCGCLRLELMRERASRIGQLLRVKTCAWCGREYVARGPQKFCTRRCYLDRRAASVVAVRGQQHAMVLAKQIEILQSGENRMNPTSLALQLPPKSLDCLPTGEVERLTNMTVAELREQLAQSLQVTATGLMRLAVVVRILEDRGEDLSELRVPLLTYLRQIATGRLLPAVVARFAETPALVSIVGRFPLRDQAALANGDSVRLVVLGEGGKPTHRLADPTKLTPTQRGQVFARDHVRSEEEQILLLESNRSRAPVWKGGATKFGKVHVDRAAGTIRIGRSLASVEDAVKALRACGIIP